MAHSPLEHVLDTKRFVLFTEALTGNEIAFDLPSISLLGYEFQITKFMVLEIVAALVILGIYVWPGRLAQRIQDGSPPKGGFWNAFESLLTFIREEVAKPYIGHHDADKYVPFLWTMFLFILVCNLLGMFPFLGSPTASFGVTAGLALCSCVLIHGSAIAKMGPLHYLESYVPNTGMPLIAALPLIVLIVFIEVFGHFIKTFVLAVRLFANMMGGHTVLAVILGFITMAVHAGPLLFVGITVGSVLGVVALSLLELFVAFLQAFIFVFLTSLFLGSALHPEH